MRSTPIAALLGAALNTTACGAPSEDVSGAAEEATGPLMRPGDNCLRCHSEGTGTGAPPWFAGGTVFSAKDASPSEGVLGVDVLLTGADGETLHLVTNEVGNFYTPVVLQKPFHVAIEYQGKREEMPLSPPAGSCNACHSLPPVGNAPGRIYVP